MKKTFTMIKPDITSRGLVGPVISEIEKNGFRVIAMEMLTLSPDRASEFYSEHKERPFFGEMIETITSGPVVAMIIESDDHSDVQLGYRDVLGHTNPEEASEGTIRKAYGISVGQNSVHGSDSLDSAKREIEFFFGPDSL